MHALFYPHAIVGFVNKYKENLLSMGEINKKQWFPYRFNYLVKKEQSSFSFLAYCRETVILR